MSDDLTPQIRRAPFDALPHAEWPDVAAALTIPWPKSAAAHDLRWFAAEHAVRDAKLPSVRELADRWGWTRTRAHDLLADGEAWADSARPWGWRDSTDKTKIRTASGQHPDSIRTVGGQTERANADKSPPSGQPTDTIRTASGHDPDSRAILTGSPDTRHPTPREIPTGSAPAPADASPPPKAKRSPKVKPEPHPYHQRVIDAWDRTWSERNPGTPYPWSPRDVATLARAVRDPLVHRDERGVEDLQRVGAAFRRYLGQQVDGRYVRGLSVSGFARDPALWFVGAATAEPATGSPRRRSSTRVPSLAELLNVNHEHPTDGDRVVIDITPRTTCH